MNKLSNKINQNFLSKICMAAKISVIACVALIACTSFNFNNPFRQTQLSKSQKIKDWWENVVLIKYYKVNFNTFYFTDISEFQKGYGQGYKHLADSINTLLSRVQDQREKKGPWVAVFDNRKQFCGILSESTIVADAGKNKTDKGQVIMNMFLNTLHLPDGHYIVDGIDYYTDSLGRIKKVYCANVILQGRGRNRGSQHYSVTFKDGHHGLDDAGHLIPQQLYGPTEQINYVPQKKALNEGKIRTLETKAAKAKRMGYKVSYEIHILYRGKEKRPYGFENNFKAYDNTGKIVQNISGIFDNTIEQAKEN
jgi:hypothetical protein